MEYQRKYCMQKFLFNHQPETRCDYLFRIYLIQKITITVNNLSTVHNTMQKRC